jgi:hypothetical protein
MTGKSGLETDFFSVLTEPVSGGHLCLKALKRERNYLESYIFQTGCLGLAAEHHSKLEIQMQLKLQSTILSSFPKALLFMFALIFSNQHLCAQFIDHFNGTGTPEGWVFLTGDGSATIDFQQKNGIASLHVDATKDKLNIWWALARRQIPGLDMEKLSQPEYELRIEARIRSSHAPRRVNLHANHQRTTDFHSHLMEFDIPDTINWHTISMTTRDFETQPGDSVNAHLALMDWGLKKYRVDFDYFRVDVVDRNKTGKDLGNPLPYHPPLADPSSFRRHLVVAHDAVIDNQFTNRNFNNWEARDTSKRTTKVLTVSGTQLVIMRWDFASLEGRKVKRSGLLELSPHSVQRSPDFQKDFGMVRISEVLAGDPAWNEQTVTFDNLKGNQSTDHVFNSQMIIDDSVTWDTNGKVFFTISQPVLQRLIDGKTLGLAITPLGAINASFFSKDAGNQERSPRLHLDVE